MKPICHNCECTNFRSTSEYGLCLHEGERKYYFVHNCMSCNHPIYIVSDKGFNNRQQVFEDDFEVIKPSRNNQVAADYED